MLARVSLTSSLLPIVAIVCVVLDASTQSALTLRTTMLKFYRQSLLRVIAAVVGMKFQISAGNSAPVTAVTGLINRAVFSLRK